MITKMFVG